MADFVHQPMTAIRGGALQLPATTILHSPFCDLQQDLKDLFTPMHVTTVFPCLIVQVRKYSLVPESFMVKPAGRVSIKSAWIDKKTYAKSGDKS